MTESYSIPARDPGIQLYIRNKRPADMTGYSAERTVLYVHGSTSASEATFDLPLDGMSWMDYIARHGYDVYLVDVRGYGRSTRLPEFDEPPANHPAIVRTDVAVRDLAAAVDHILARRAIAKLDLVGWSWGGTLVGTYAAQNGDKVNRLVLYAPPWIDVSASAAGPTTLGAYRAWTPASARQRVQTGAPAERQKELFPDAWFESYSAAVLATDPVGAAQNPPVVRTPNGVNQDNIDFWTAGKPYYDPSAIAVPTLVIRGEWDGIAPTTQELFRKLTSAPEKRFVEIGAGSHLLFLEKNRTKLFDEVQTFLDGAVR